MNTAGRPEIRVAWEASPAGESQAYLVQFDPTGGERVWPQRFEIMAHTAEGVSRREISSAAAKTILHGMHGSAETRFVFNADGAGYGLYPAAIENLHDWDQLGEVEEGAELINLFENMLTGSAPDVQTYFLALQKITPTEQNQLVLRLALDQLNAIFWRFLPCPAREEYVGELERVLWQAIMEQTESSKKKIYFEAFADIALSAKQVQKVYAVWSGSLEIENLPLSENDRIDLAQVLAIKLPQQATEIFATQISNTRNPDNQRKLQFLAPSLSADSAERDRFFYSLAEEGNRHIESWVLAALRNLHHPLRTDDAEQYLLPSLELLQEIQVTGDIFIPQLWLDVTFGNYRSSTAVHTVEAFLEQRPDYNAQLRMKILQSTDTLLRANAISLADGSDVWKSGCRP